MEMYWLNGVLFLIVMFKLMLHLVILLLVLIIWGWFEMDRLFIQFMLFVNRLKHIPMSIVMIFTFIVCSLVVARMMEVHINAK